MVKNISVATAAVTTALLLGGCASVVNSPHQTVSVLSKDQRGSDVTDARCELQNDKGVWHVTTPGSVMVQRSNQDLQIACSKTGYDTSRRPVTSEMQGAMLGNIILGGAIGAAIDHSNGSAYEYPPVIEISMMLLTPEEIAARAAREAQAKAEAQVRAERAVVLAAAAAARAATLAPMAIGTGRKPQEGDEWEYLVTDRIFGKQKKLLWRVKSTGDQGVAEELLVDGNPVQTWTFNGRPVAIGAPTDMGFIFGQHWDALTRIPELQVQGQLGDCVQRGQCIIDSKISRMDRITIAAGTFDAVRIDGTLILAHMAVRPKANISIWYSQRDRRVLKQVAIMRDVSRTIDETIELRAARAYP